MAEIGTTVIKKVKRYQYGVDHLKQVVLIRTVFLDDTTSDTMIPRKNIQQTVDYLARALKAFQAQDDQTKQ
jgi:hypothetical protein